MDLEIRKQKLINWISTIREVETLEKVEEIRKGTVDWWDTLDIEDVSAINEGLRQLNSGNFISQEQVKTIIKEKFKF